MDKLKLYFYDISINFSDNMGFTNKNGKCDIGFTNKMVSLTEFYITMD